MFPDKFALHYLDTCDTYDNFDRENYDSRRRNLLYAYMHIHICLYLGTYLHKFRSKCLVNTVKWVEYIEISSENILVYIFLSTNQFFL